MPHKPNHKAPRDSFLDVVEKGLAGINPALGQPATIMGVAQKALALPRALRESREQSDAMIERAAKPMPSLRKKKKAKGKPEPAAAAKPAPSKAAPAAPVAMPDPVVDSPSRFDAVGDSHFSRERYDGTPAYPNEGGQHYLRPIALPADPFGGGGQLDPRDPTSFAPPPEEFEPAWDKRERDMAARAMLRRQLRAAQARGPMGP